MSKASATFAAGQKYIVRAFAAALEAIPLALLHETLGLVKAFQVASENSVLEIECVSFTSASMPSCTLNAQTTTSSMMTILLRC